MVRATSSDVSLRYVLQVGNNAQLAERRWYTFQGVDRMSLRVDSSELNPPVVESTFVWKRVK